MERVDLDAITARLDSVENASLVVEVINWATGNARADIAALVAEVRLLRDALDAGCERSREIERCARGVVRTAHPDATTFMIADGWWNALKAALALSAPVAGEEEA